MMNWKKELLEIGKYAGLEVDSLLEAVDIFLDIYKIIFFLQLPQKLIFSQTNKKSEIVNQI